jgi:hypothetical protein
MRTREDTHRTGVTEQGPSVGVLGSIGHTTALVVWALLGCLVLIAVVATLSVCWSVHPLLTAVAAVALLWAAARAAGRLFR